MGDIYSIAPRMTEHWARFRAPVSYLALSVALFFKQVPRCRDSRSTNVENLCALLYDLAHYTELECHYETHGYQLWRVTLPLWHPPCLTPSFSLYMHGLYVYICYHTYILRNQPFYNATIKVIMRNFIKMTLLFTDRRDIYIVIKYYTQL